MDTRASHCHCTLSSYPTISATHWLECAASQCVLELSFFPPVMLKHSAEETGREGRKYHLFAMIYIKQGAGGCCGSNWPSLPAPTLSRSKCHHFSSPHHHLPQSPPPCRHPFTTSPSPCRLPSPITVSLAHRKPHHRFMTYLIQSSLFRSKVLLK